MRFYLLFLSFTLLTISASAQVSLLKDIYPGYFMGIAAGSSPVYLTSCNGNIFFNAVNAKYGFELWKTDGTLEGTVLVKDINPGSESSYPNNLTAIGSILYFTAGSGTQNGLWKSDGTSEGTVFVKALYAISNLTVVNGLLFFTAADDQHGVELWKSDGTDAGTVMVKDIYSGPDGSFPMFLTSSNGLCFLLAYNNVSGSELWRSDGTESGTFVTKDIMPGNNGQCINGIAASRYGVYFNHCNGLWKSDGTVDGTVMIKPIIVSFPYDLKTLGDTLYFVGYTNAEGSELWKSDGTSEGTVLIKDIYPGPGNSYPDNINFVDGRAYFTANSTSGSGIWTTDGTESGTTFLHESSNSDSSGIMISRLFYNKNNAFMLSQSTTASGIWKIDNTSLEFNLLFESDTIQLTGQPLMSRVIALDTAIIFAGGSKKTGEELCIFLETSNAPVLSAPIQSYPNPVTDILTIDSATEGLKAIDIIDSNGKVAFAFEFNGKSVQLNVKQLGPGIFYLRDNNSSTTQRFIKR